MTRVHLWSKAITGWDSRAADVACECSFLLNDTNSPWPHPKQQSNNKLPNSSLITNYLTQSSQG